jgi:glycosidase
MFNLLGSHDKPRFLTLCSGDTRKMKLAAAFLMTYPGAPVIYYGDEIGMTGVEDPDCRRTFVWDEEKQARELLAFFRELIQLRKSEKILRRGRAYELWWPDSRVVGLLRELGSERVLALFNAADGPARPKLSDGQLGSYDVSLEELLKYTPRPATVQLASWEFAMFSI